MCMLQTMEVSHSPFLDPSNVRPGLGEDKMETTSIKPTKVHTHIMSAGLERLTGFHTK